MSAYHNPCKHLLWVVGSSSGVLQVVLATPSDLRGRHPRASSCCVSEPSTQSLKECVLALSLCRALQVFKELPQASGNDIRTLPQFTSHKSYSG